MKVGNTPISLSWLVMFSLKLLLFKKKLYDPFLWMGFNFVKATLRGGGSTLSRLHYEEAGFNFVKATLRGGRVQLSRGYITKRGFNFVKATLRGGRVQLCQGYITRRQGSTFSRLHYEEGVQLSRGYIKRRGFNFLEATLRGGGLLFNIGSLGLPRAH